MHKVIQCTKKCLRRVKGFAIRGSIVAIALFAVFFVMVWTGESVPLAMAIERIAEAMGYALADTLVDV
jgi:hypothetical protein